MKNPNRFEKYAAEAWVITKKKIPIIIFLNLFLLAFFLIGANMSEIVYTMFVQFIAVGILVPFKMYALKDYRTIYRTVSIPKHKDNNTLLGKILNKDSTESAEYVPLTKGTAIIIYLAIFLLYSGFLLLMLSNFISYNGVTIWYLIMGFILQLLYEIKEYYNFKKESTEIIPSLFDYGWNALLFAVPIIIVIFASAFVGIKISIIGIIIIKVLHEILLVYHKENRVRIDTYFSEKERRYRESQKSR